MIEQPTLVQEQYLSLATPHAGVLGVEELREAMAIFKSIYQRDTSWMEMGLARAEALGVVTWNCENCNHTGVAIPIGAGLAPIRLVDMTSDRVYLVDGSAPEDSHTRVLVLEA